MKNYITIIISPFDLIIRVEVPGANQITIKQLLELVQRVHPDISLAIRRYSSLGYMLTEFNGISNVEEWSWLCFLNDKAIQHSIDNEFVRVGDSIELDYCLRKRAQRPVLTFNTLYRIFFRTYPLRTNSRGEQNIFYYFSSSRTPL